MGRFENLHYKIVLFGFALFIQGCKDVAYVPPTPKTVEQTSTQTPNPIPDPIPDPEPTTPDPDPSTPDPQPPGPTPLTYDVILRGVGASFVDSNGVTWSIGSNHRVLRNGAQIDEPNQPKAMWQTNVLVINKEDQSIYIWGLDGQWYIFDGLRFVTYEGLASPISTQVPANITITSTSSPSSFVDSYGYVWRVNSDRTVTWDGTGSVRIYGYSSKLVVNQVIFSTADGSITFAASSGYDYYWDYESEYAHPL